MDKDKRYWKYGLLVYIITNYVLHLGDRLELLIYIVLAITLLVYLINLIKNQMLGILSPIPVKNESKIWGVTVLTLVIILDVYLALELYTKIVHSKYFSLFQNYTVSVIAKIYVLMLIPLILVFAYKQADRDKKYIAVRYVKLVALGGIMALIVFLLTKI
ncbi:hypothetical protein [Clostridium thailandense]|uniref:hypothetical protein n=1 Tax=Clostridium thailandense TaxID=2794346 RepID=UPI003989BF8E